MGKTHKIGGLFAGVLVSSYLVSDDFVVSCVSVGTVMLGSVLGSWLPDIDKKESTIGRKLWFISWPIYFFRLLVYIAAVVIPKKFDKPWFRFYKNMGHRGISHSFITLIILSFGFQYLYNLISWDGKYFLSKVVYSLLVGVTVGMFSHIILDLFTTQGVALLCPFFNFRFKIPVVRTNSVREKIVGKLLTVGIFVVSIILIAS